MTTFLEDCHRLITVDIMTTRDTPPRCVTIELMRNLSITVMATLGKRDLINEVIILAGLISSTNFLYKYGAILSWP